MLHFPNPQALSQWVREQIRDSSTERRDMEIAAGRSRSYYIGIHWLQQGQATGGYSRLFRTSINDTVASGRIKATINEITGNIIRIAAATNPEKLNVDALPLHHITGISGAKDSDLMENFANMLIEKSGLLQSARTANFERSIDGRHGVGIRIQSSQINGVANTKLKSFEFDGYRLTTDQTTRSDNLEDNEFVIYSDVMSIHAIRRVYGEEALFEVDQNKMNTVAELTPTEHAFYYLSGGKMYADYFKHSKEKGALVHEIYIKGSGDRFDRRYVMLSTGGSENDDRVPNFDNPVNPIGLKGMPYILLKPGSRDKVSDTALMLDNQDKLNLTGTLFFQQLYDYVNNSIWFIDQSWFGSGRADKSEIMEEFNRGYVFGNARDRRGSPPVQIQNPPPNPALEQTMSSMISQVKESAFQSSVHRGQLKSHVTDGAVQLAADLVERPLDDRVKDDVESYQRLISTITATGIGMVRSESPDLIVSMTKQGFSNQMIGEIGNMDPTSMPVSLALRDQALRPRSRQQRVSQVERGIELGAVDPSTYSRLMATLDMAIDPLDKETMQFANMTAAGMLDGQPYQPISLGSRVNIMLDALQRASMDTIARANPEIQQAIEEAKISQMEIDGLLQSEEDELAPEPEGPQQADLQSILGGVSIPPA